MTCVNRVYQKSTQEAYNNAVQPYIAAGTQIAILGSRPDNTGCSIDTDASGFTVLNSGIYRFAYDVTSTPADAGEQVMQLYLDGIPLPQAITTDTTVADAILTQHVETVMELRTCCAVNHAITAQISGVAGNINHVQASAVKLA